MKNESLIKGSEINNLKNIINLAKGTIKIILKINDNKEIPLSSGFFLELERNNEPFYCLMTNAHVITQNLINNKETIKINYNNENNELLIKLDKKERIIICFDEFKIDITIVEIIPKDKINKDYFLKPKDNISYKNLKNKEIQIIQYPKAEDISKSEGKIKTIWENFDYMFSHDASTLKGSSGSPIVLKGDNKVIGIHQGGNEKKSMNYGIFIAVIFDSIKDYIKEGEYIEYYENGNKKYEGYFMNDEYDGKGIFYDENGKDYKGIFKNGKKEGDFQIYKDDEFIKETKYENDKEIEIEKNKEDIKEKNETLELNEDNPINNILMSLINPLKKNSKIRKDVKCKRNSCGHELKYHFKTLYGDWICRQCDKDNCICKVDVRNLF